MKLLGILMLGLLMVFSAAGLQYVRANEADEAYKTGLKYYSGDGVAQDYTAAMEWFKKAADKGMAAAQFCIGTLYADGKGVSQNYQEALKWYRKAAVKGLVDAQLAVGVMYFNGQGVARNHTEAFKWYRKAADQGNALAQFNIGVMYDTGRSVTQNYPEAMKWYRKAADQGNGDARRLMEKLESEMSAKAQTEKPQTVDAFAADQIKFKLSEDTWALDSLRTQQDLFVAGNTRDDTSFAELWDKYALEGKIVRVPANTPMTLTGRATGMAAEVIVSGFPGK